MKYFYRWIITCLLALLLCVPAGAEESGDRFDYTIQVIEDGSQLYYFEDLSLQIPAGWLGKVIALKSDDGVSFYQAASFEKYLEEGITSGGFLFKLSASVNTDFKNLPAYEYIGFSENTAMNYFMILPSDYPAYNDAPIRAEYDELLSNVSEIAENAYIYPAAENAENAEGADGEGEAEQGTSGEMEAAAGGWTAAQIRYSFEHNMMPRYYYERPENVLNGLEEVGLYYLWETVCVENGCDPTYPEEDYKEHWYTSGSGTIVQVELPEPDENLLCYRIYFLYDPENDRTAYYTMESEVLTPGSGMICMWDAEGTHTLFGAAPALDRNSEDYEEGLRKEAETVAELAGFGPVREDPSRGASPDNGSDSGQDITQEPGGGQDMTQEPDMQDLAVVSCPEQGFSTMADPAYGWEYEDEAGVVIYTGNYGGIPYVIAYQDEDLIAEPFEYIREQFTPHIQNSYGADLISYEEIEDYEIGGKILPAGFYVYRLQDYIIEMIRIYDSTGSRTAAFTAKYIQGRGEETLKALDTAIRYFQPE